jgi:hypothetical protein
MFHPQLFLVDFLTVLRRLIPVKLANMQELRLKSNPSDINPQRDERLATLLEGVQVRVLNRTNLLATLPEYAELCRAMALFRFETGSFWIEIAEILRPMLMAKQEDPQIITDIAWAFGRTKVVSIEVSDLLRSMASIMTNEPARFSDHHMFVLLWAMNSCNTHDDKLTNLYKVRMTALDEQEVVLEETGKESELPAETLAKYTSLYDILGATEPVSQIDGKNKPINEFEELYDTSDPAQEATLKEDGLPEWAARYQAFRLKVRHC